MGCPPDPVEVSIWRSGERIGVLEEKYHRLIDEYAEAEKVAQELLDDYEPQREPYAKEKFTRRTDVIPTEQDPYADDAAQWRLENEYARRVKELETKLCALRFQLTSHEGERLRHLAHREEDRAQWLAWLRDRLRVIEYALSEKDEQPHFRLDRKKARRMVRDLGTEIQRLEGLTQSQLISDPEILKIDEDRWATPYLD